jgi:hypothetical protein
MQHESGAAAPLNQFEPRLLAVLDHVQDHFHNQPIVLLSGFRARKYNQSLRNKGRMAAQSSMHIEGGAADLFIKGVASAKVAAFARSLDCCGVGYYHGRSVHIDTGPVRHWDETTSGTESRKPQRNAKIILSTPYDMYAEGESIALRLLRITEFPIVVPSKITLECQVRGKWKKVGTRGISVPSNVKKHNKCHKLMSYSESRALQWPSAISFRKCRTDQGAGRYRARLAFCEQLSEEMPNEVVSNIFQIGY